MIPPRYVLRLSVSGVPVAAATAILQLIGGKKISAATQEICDSIFIGNHPIATSGITKGFQVGNKKRVKLVLDFVSEEARNHATVHRLHLKDAKLLLGFTFFVNDRDIPPPSRAVP